MIKKILAIVLVVAIVALASFKLFFSKGDIKKEKENDLSYIFSFNDLKEYDYEKPQRQCSQSRDE